MNKTILFTIVILLLVTNSLNAQNGTWGEPGSGNYENTWYTANPNATVFDINNASQLAGLAYQVNEGKISFQGKTIKLTADIDLSTSYWSGIGTSETSFEGSFDGENHTISGMYMDNRSVAVRSGFFNYMGNYNAEEIIEIKNLTLSDGEIYGGASDNTSSSIVGALVASSNGKLMITNCHNKGVRVFAGEGASAGGLVGSSIEYLVFISCSNEAALKAGESFSKGIGTGLGGFVGFGGGDIKIKSSFNSGNLETKSRNSYAGGFIGWTWHGEEVEIIDSYSSSNIISTAGPAGGIIGQFGGAGNRHQLAIERCFVTGSIENKSGSYKAFTGGIIGEIDHIASKATIKDCFVMMQSLSGDTVRRIAGTIGVSNYKEMLENNYAYIQGKISGWEKVGANDLSGADWNGSMLASPIANWDESVWTIYNTGTDIHKYLPQLQIFGNSQPLIPNPLADLSGTYWTDEGNYEIDWYTDNPNADVFEINSAPRLAGLAYLVNSEKITFKGKLIKLTADVNLSAYWWIGVGQGNESFQGSFDGNSHNISGMKINVENEIISYSGLFGKISNDDEDTAVEIKNVVLEDGDIRGGIWKGSTTGALASMILGKGKVIITGCHNNGVAISGGGGSFIGGLVGFSGNLSLITCSNNILIESREENQFSYETFVGGLVGYAGTSLEIKSCYNNGATVKALSEICYTGGFVGMIAPGTKLYISDSYNVSDIVSTTYAGGLVGYINETSAEISILSCFVTGSIENTYNGTKESGTGGIAGHIYNVHPDIKVEDCLVLAQSLTGETAHRIIGWVSYLNNNSTYLKNNYAYISTQQSGWDKVGANDMDGADWDGSMSSLPIKNWDENVWDIYNTGADVNKYMPQLKAFGLDQPLIPNPIDNSIIFTVVFDSRGGTSVPSQTVGMNGTLTQPAEPTKAGFTFEGWYTNTNYTDKWVFGSEGTKVTQNTTLYAKWICTVIFDSQGGTPVSSQIVEIGSTLIEPEIPLKSGFIFKGWYTDTEYKNRWEFGNAGSVVETNTTLYARWIKDGFVFIHIPAIEGVTISIGFGEHEVESGTILVIVITLSSDYSNSNIYLVINGATFYPITDGNLRSTSTSYTFHVPVELVDMEIEIKGVEQNNATGIDKLKESFSIYTSIGHLHIDSPKAGKISIYTITGQLYTQCNIQAGATTISLSKGIYFIEINNEIKKIVIE